MYKIFCVIFFATIIYADDDSKDYYTAGVVEFQPVLSGMPSADLLMDHLNGYNQILYSEEAKEADIIVFPEGTLNNALEATFVPAEEDCIIPCLNHADYSEFLANLSCTAREVRKYVVINLTEKENCTAILNDPRPCAPSGLNIYNTNVVFDRNGCVISRYRKVHVYVEAKNTTLQPEFAIFETDFGIRFGHFICFDILFYTPAQELVDRFHLKNLIFTSMFYSELPFLTAVQLQLSWAWANDINLLAAGASYPAAGMTGSGIYAGQQGSIISTMVINGSGIRKLFVGRLSKNKTKMSSTKNAVQPISSSTKPSQPSLPVQPNNKSKLNGIKLLRDPQITKYKSMSIDFSASAAAHNLTQNLCDGDLCCDFAIVAMPTKPFNNESIFYKYRIGVFDGRRTYEKDEWSDIKVCALYACTNASVDSCGEMHTEGTAVEANFLFKSIKITGYFRKVSKMLIMPNSLNNELYSLGPDSVKWSVEDGNGNAEHYVAHFSLNNEHSNILTFAIYAQYYEKSAGLNVRVESNSFISTILIVFALHSLLKR